jgi:hypothetical protein
MAKGWITDLLKQSQRRQVDQNKRAELDDMAKAQLPHLFQRLSDQIATDVSEYQHCPGARQIAVSRGADHFAVGNSEFPHFKISLVARESFIELHVKVKETKTTYNPPNDREIYVAAEGPELLTYRLEGKQYIDVSDLSETILRPVLKLLMDR